ncbi:hypothetical protein AAY473_023484 [Plecturocebus cupreus]
MFPTLCAPTATCRFAEATNSKEVKGLTVSPRLECSGMITAHFSLDLLDLLGSSDPPALASPKETLHNLPRSLQVIIEKHSFDRVG